MRLAHAGGSCGLSVLWRPAQGSLTLERRRFKAVPSQATAFRSKPRDWVACIRARSSLQARCLPAPIQVFASRVARKCSARCRSDETREPLQAAPRAPEFKSRLCTERRLTLPSRGPAPASRVGPLMSNVRRLKRHRRRLQRRRENSLKLQPLDSSAHAHHE